ncbi:hypothetical protein DSO57_1013809 [Entomophthora muscae]|uniref:Uncharacterized protein n=1 Tax=Entomophthora muscae TaxID=34485 RepID=A0ACC2RWU2_9FUNG|nr:hypothetical protein DSO57_1013809 [Entomophthora muscae]
MEMHISSSFKFIYPNEYGSYKLNVVDMIETIVHELCHGLGFYSEITSNLQNPDYFGPSFNLNSSKADSVYKSLFDTFLHNTNPEKPQRDENTNSASFLKTRNSVYFKTKYNKKVNISTDDESNTVAFFHIDKDYRNTPDFLMSACTLGYGYFVAYRNLSDWKTSPLGLATIEILETLGYQRNRYASRLKSQIGFYEKMRRFNHMQDELNDAK